MPNTQEISNNLNRDGFVYLPSFLEGSRSLKKILITIREAVELTLRKKHMFSKEYTSMSLDDLLYKLLNDSEKNIAFLNDIINAHPSIYNLFSDEKIVNLINELFYFENSFLCTNNYRIRIQSPGRDGVTNLPWHQDSHYNAMGKANTSCAVWVSLSDIDEELGPVVFKKGSNNLGKLESKIFTKPNGNEVFTVSNEYVNDMSYEEVAIPSKCGDVILINMDVIHRSGNNNSKNQTKISAQARFHQAGNKNFNV